MPKLTEEEKLANKATLKLKRAAHTARRRAMEAREKELLEERVAPLAAVMEETFVVFDEALNARNEYDTRCRVEAETLRKKHAAERVPYETEVARLAAERTAAADARNAETRRVTKQVEEEFPDLVGHARYSAAGWTPPRTP